jgi:hypothetical protein
MSIEQLINGYLVVRKPSHNFDAKGRAGFRKVPARIGEFFYGGMMRMPWFDLDEAYYNGTLPSELRNHLEQIDDANKDLTGIDLCADQTIARRILAFSNQEASLNEIIVIHSEELAKIKGSMVKCPVEVDWHGFDIVQLGEWSLLEDGIFAKPAAFPHWVAQLNAKGLLNSSEGIQDLVADYQTAVAAGLVEPLGPLVNCIAVSVGRLVGQ